MSQMIEVGIELLRGCATRDHMRESKRPLLLLAGENTYVAFLQGALEASDFRTVSATDVTEALRLTRERQPELIVVNAALLDVRDVEGLDSFFAEAKAQEIPVLVIAHPVDRANGGARQSEMLTEPFTLKELLDRIRAVLDPSRQESGDRIAADAIVMDLAAHRVYLNGKPIDFSPIEYRLLQHFIAHPRRVFTREQLIEAVWGKNIHVVERAVDVQVSRIRRTLYRLSNRNYIRTVRGFGYSLDPD
jgi:two-component system phosphate regulon response regulator PhoB